MSNFRTAQSVADIQVVINEDQDQSLFVVTNTGGYQWILTTEENQAADHDHAQQAYPQMFLHSETDPDSNNAKWLGLSHNDTNGIIESGAGDIHLIAADNDVRVGDGTAGQVFSLDGVGGGASDIAFR